MDQFEVMSELYSDRSNWADIRHYPSTVTCRRMLRLADFAAADPARWSSCRMAFEVPELSYRELAVARGVSHTTIMRHLAKAEVGDAGDFTDRELDGECPEWLRTIPVRFDVGRVSRTWRYATALCTFAAAQPERWRVLRLAYECPELSQAELAKLCGVSQQSVSNYLQPVRLEVDESFNDLEVIY
ncbi:winged helix-turn-helix transcriptional regulator [Victivallis vadensis]|uniref:winged helix-turn-helix transcriptional regulator n=1 Tax=Victivallis vadensis TaxID=172901 RepID=UPI003CFE3D2B